MTLLEVKVRAAEDGGIADEEAGGPKGQGSGV